MCRQHNTRSTYCDLLCNTTALQTRVDPRWASGPETGQIQVLYGELWAARGISNIAYIFFNSSCQKLEQKVTAAKDFTEKICQHASTKDASLLRTHDYVQAGVMKHAQVEISNGIQRQQSPFRTVVPLITTPENNTTNRHNNVSCEVRRSRGKELSDP